MDMRAGNLFNYLSAQGGGTPLPIYNLRRHANSLHRSYELFGARVSGGGECDQVPDAAPEHRAAAILSRTTMQSTSRRRFRAISSTCASTRTSPPNQSIYGRFTWKNRSVTTAPEARLHWLLRDQPVAFAWWHRATGAGPGLDGGLQLHHQSAPDQRISRRLQCHAHVNSTANVNSASLINQVGITGIPDIATVPTVPDVQIVGLQRTGGLNTTRQQSKVIQLLDDLDLDQGKKHFQVWGRCSAVDGPRRKCIRQLSCRPIHV